MERKNPGCWPRALCTVQAPLEIFTTESQGTHSVLDHKDALAYAYVLAFVSFIHSLLEYLFSTHASGPAAAPAAGGPVVNEKSQPPWATVLEGETYPPER